MQKEFIKRFSCHENFYNYLNAHFYITDPEMDKLLPHIYVKEYDKNKLITPTKPNTDQKLYYIVNGLVRLFNIKNHTEATLHFISESNLLLLNPSGIQHDQLYQIEAVTNCTLIEISTSFFLNNKKTFYQLWQDIQIKVLQQFNERNIEHLDYLLLKDAKEMYKSLLGKERHIDKIPINTLSSYLGIHPNSLSRIRNEMRKERQPNVSWQK